MTSNWFTIEVADGCNFDDPGIYVWHVENVPIYAGKSVRLKHRFREYRRNIDRMDHNRPYHIRGQDFRSIHHMLSNAKQDGKAIKVVVVANCLPPEDIRALEREWIARISDLALKRSGAET